MYQFNPSTRLAAFVTECGNENVHSWPLQQIKANILSNWGMEINADGQMVNTERKREKM